MTRDEIERKLIDIVRHEKSDIPDEKLTAATPLAEAGIDSLDALTILFAIEEDFHISVPTSPRKRGEVRRRPAQLTLIDRNHAPAVAEAIDPRQRQGIDNKAQCAVGRQIERDREHRADGAGMHHQHRIARR